MNQPLFSDLIRPTTAANLLDIDFTMLSYYRRKGKFCKEFRIDGHPFFLREDVLNWNPNKYKRKK